MKKTNILIPITIVTLTLLAPAIGISESGENVKPMSASVSVNKTGWHFVAPSQAGFHYLSDLCDYSVWKEGDCNAAYYYDTYQDYNSSNPWVYWNESQGDSLYIRQIEGGIWLHVNATGRLPALSGDDFSALDSSMWDTLEPGWNSVGWNQSTRDMSDSISHINNNSDANITQTWKMVNDTTGEIKEYWNSQNDNANFTYPAQFFDYGMTEGYWVCNNNQSVLDRGYCSCSKPPLMPWQNNRPDLTNATVGGSSSTTTTKTMTTETNTYTDIEKNPILKHIPIPKKMLENQETEETLKLKTETQESILENQPGNYTFTINYTDPEGQAPSKKTVNIDGTNYTMNKVSGTYTDGAKYQYKTHLNPGTHKYYFVFNDSIHETQRPWCSQDNAYNHTYTIEINGPPNISLNSPSDGAVNTSLNPTLNITATDPNGDQMNVTMYGNGTQLHNEENIANGTTITYEWTGLNHNTTYNWHTEATDGTDTTQSPTWNFTTAPNQPPTPQYTYNKKNWKQITLDASSSTDTDGTIQSYTWNLGDGENATGKTTTHTYNNPGNYTIKLTVEDDDGTTKTQNKTIRIAYKLITTNKPNYGPDNEIHTTVTNTQNKTITLMEGYTCNPGQTPEIHKQKNGTWKNAATVPGLCIYKPKKTLKPNQTQTWNWKLNKTLKKHIQPTGNYRAIIKYKKEKETIVKTANETFNITNTTTTNTNTQENTENNTEEETNPKKEPQENTKPELNS